MWRDGPAFSSSRCGARSHQLPSSWVWHALFGERGFRLSCDLTDNLPIFGEGLQTRSFCYVDDVIDGFFKFMATDAGFTRPVNLGNVRQFTICELPETVIDLT